MANCKHTDGDRHDCEYVDSRNALIPAAEREADRIAGPAPVRYGSIGGATKEKLAALESWRAKWDRVFLLAMDRLWIVEKR